MNSPQIFFFTLLTVLIAGLGKLSGQEPSGQWKAPTADGKPWKHADTGLTFPAYLQEYRFAGYFGYQDGGVLLRYENLAEQARADIFIFKTGSALPALEDRHRRILAEMDTVKTDMEAMVKQGRYKNLQASDPVGGQLDLWQQQSLPIATRVITVTRIGVTQNGTAEAVVSQWIGVTILGDYIITIRHMRPISTGQAGEEGLKQLVGSLFQIIKDPSIRSHIEKLVDDYMADPFAEYSIQASGAVLAYLKQNPRFPINIPENPISGWLSHAKQIAPGTEDHLLRAFMLGSAKAAFADGDAETCLREGSRQFAKVYRILVSQNPQISRPEIEQFATAAEKGLGAAWLKEQGMLR